MLALNTLISELEKEYQCVLVISSSWRYKLSFAIKTLYKNGLNYKGEILSTPIYKNPLTRGSNIINFLKSKPNNSNYVVIDNGFFDFKKTIDLSLFIKTNIYSSGLTLEQVNTFTRHILNQSYENKNLL